MSVTHGRPSVDLGTFTDDPSGLVLDSCLSYLSRALPGIPSLLEGGLS